MARRKLRLKVEYVKPVGAVSLEPGDLARLSGDWGSGGGWDGAWEDIRYLARLVFAACQQSDKTAALSRWHHLLLAVGNYKRQAGMVTPPNIAPKGFESSPAPTSQFVVPGTEEALDRDDAESWKVLTDMTRGKVKGLGVPTATTLLSALWPEDHLILDVQRRPGGGGRWPRTDVEVQSGSRPKRCGAGRRHMDLGVVPMAQGLGWTDAQLHSA